MTPPSDDLVRPDSPEGHDSDVAVAEASAASADEASAAPGSVATETDTQAASHALDLEEPTSALTSDQHPATGSESPHAVAEHGVEASDPSEESRTAEGEEAASDRTPSDVAVMAAGPAVDGESPVAVEGEGAASAEAENAEPSTPPVPSEQLETFFALMRSFADEEPVEGKVIGWNKGGFHVSLSGVPGFCPKSQIELGNPKKSSNYVGRDFRFKIIEVRDGGKRIVISRAAILKQEKQRLLKEVVVAGKVLDGTVSNVTDFGAFVDLGGIEGLVHLSKLSRRRIDHPRDLLKVGDPVKVRVLKVEKGGNRISLSMKDLEPDPWDSAAERYPSGSKVDGTVLRAAEFGLFVEVEPGLEGLVHTSQLPLGKGMEDPSLQPGTAVSCWVREVDGPRHRLSLAMREVAAHDPWEGLSERYPEGAEVEGRVEQVAKFGLFVELEPGLSGLLPFSLMSMPEGTRPERTYAAGQTIAVQVSAIDYKRRRISLVPKGRQLEGTKADYREYQKKQKQTSASGLNVMAAAFARLDSGPQNRP